MIIVASGQCVIPTQLSTPASFKKTLVGLFPKFQQFGSFQNKLWPKIRNDRTTAGAVDVTNNVNGF